MKKNQDRRGRQSLPSPYADVELELTQLTFLNYAKTVAKGSLGLVVSTLLLAAHYHDLGIWKITWAMVLVGCARTAASVAWDPSRTPHLTVTIARRRQKIWAVLTMLYSASMCASTLYNFSHHDYTSKCLCIMGSFAVTGGLASSITVQPRVIQICGIMMMGSLGCAFFFNSEPLLGRTGGVLSLVYAFVNHEAVQKRFEIVVDQLRTRRQMRDLAERDMLTGLPNRRQFQARLTALCADLTPFAILYIDLDRFKQVNDTFGHAMGDALLIRVTERLTGLTRSSDLVARLGGDEFAILQHPVDSAQPAQALAGRINQEIAAPFAIEGEQIEVGASIGICMAGGEERDPTRLLSLADKALYSVKQAGRGSFRLGEFQN